MTSFSGRPGHEQQQHYNNDQSLCCGRGNGIGLTLQLNQQGLRADEAQNPRRSRDDVPPRYSLQ